MGFFKFRGEVSTVGRDLGQAPPGGGFSSSLPGSPASLSRALCAAGHHGVRRLQGHERQPERAAGVYAAAGNREAGSGAGEPCPLRPGRLLHLPGFALRPGFKVLTCSSGLGVQSTALWAKGLPLQPALTS